MAKLASVLALPKTFRYCTKEDFFQSAEWYSCLADAVFLDHRAAIYVTDSSALIVRPNQFGAESYTNFYSQSFRIGPDPHPIVQELAQESPGIVDLRFMPEEDAHATSRAFERCGFKVDQYFMYENWFTPLEGRSFETFFSGRSSQLRNTVRRRKKKLESEHRYEIRLDRSGTLFRDFAAVYSKSWKRPEPYPNFMPTLASTCARLGILRLGVLYIDCKAVAAQLWITTPQKAIIYKLAYDEEFKEYSVGSILSAEMFREAIDVDRVREIDYGIGSEPYKRDWMEQSRRLLGLRAHNLRSPVGASFWYAGLVKKWIKRRVRTQATLTPPSVAAGMQSETSR